MEVTPTLKIELTQWLDTYWTTYLNGDIDTWVTFISDDYRNIGGTKEEIWNSKQEIIDYTKSIMNQMLGAVDIRNREVELIPYGEYMMVNEFTDLYVKIEGKWALYGPFRMSSLLEKTDAGWIALHQHGSYPDMKAMEGEAFSFDVLKAENARLQAAVKSRTIELEIETALERVRTEAMGMKKPDDILAICKVMFTELQSLGFSELRNTLINFWDDESSSLIDYDYSNDTGGNKANLSYSSHPVFEQFQKTIKNSEDAFAELVVTRSELESWKQRRRDSGEYEDPRLNNIPALYYYFYSIAVGAIGISTFSPITEEQLNVLKRFRNVFDFAYRRYADVAQAEAQAKEAQIELALERVRARTMAMQHSNELPDAATILFQQVQSLGMPAWSAGYCTWNDDKSAVTLWMSSEGVLQPAFTAPTTEDELFIQMRKGQEDGKTFHVVEMGGDQLVKHYGYMRTLPLMGDILDSIIAAGHPLPTFQIMHHAYFSKGFLLFITYEPVPDAHDIFKRFGKVFDQTYTRFLDLQKAEAQAREAQIETALERVRSRSMGMQKSEELQEVIKIVYRQLRHLNIQLDHAGFVVDYTPKGDWHFWIADEQDIPSKITHPYFDSVWANQFNEAKEKDTDFFATHLNFEEKNKFYNEILSYVPGLPETSKEFYLNCPGLAASTVLLENVGLYIENFSGIPYTDEENTTLMRFGKVFQQTYTRFLDLQKAEAQAREAKIEAALERVRSRSMAMHKSKELLEASEIIFVEMQKLGIDSLTAGYVLMDKEEKNGLNYTPDPFTKKIMPLPVIIPHNETIHMQQVVENWKKGNSFFMVEMDEEETIQHQTFIAERSTNFPITAAQLIAISPAKLFLHNFYFKEGYILIVGGIKLSVEQTDIMLRFAKVFQQTYTRFLDLQKAEAQAREAQIEAALERVRSRTMAMRGSDELLDVATILFQQVKALGVPQWNCGFNIWEIGDKEFIFYPGTPDGIITQSPCKIPLTEHPVFQGFDESRKRGDELFTYEKEGEMQRGHYQYMLSLPGVGDVLQSMLDAGFEFPAFQIDHVVNFAYGNLIFITYEHFPEMHDVFKRFAKVFEQTYTRFLDLQKAEAQAREALIETALERVRSKTMAMHNSKDVGESVAALFDELSALGVLTAHDRCGIGIMQPNEMMELWTAEKATGKTELTIGHLDMKQHILLKNVYQNWLDKKETYQYILEGEDKLKYYEAMRNQTNYKIRKDYYSSQEKIVHTDFFFKEGCLYVFSQQTFTTDAASIFIRFVNVFGQTYRRYLDLLKAEAQAREAQIETALEKVRSRTLAMQKSDELAETASVLFQQLIALGIEPNRLYITIIHAESDEADFWITNEDGSKLTDAYSAHLEENSTFKKMYEGWKKQLKHLVIDMQGEELQNYFHYLQSRNVPFKGGLEQTRRVQHLAYFSKGFIGMASPDEQPAESLQLLERFAAVFNLTFTRFNDLKIAEAHALQAEQDLIAIKEAKQKAEEALTELQSTQKQLIQSEKMASLGELTAGIAHEIQNPLNFVNNFSEVSKELLDEMKEAIEKGDTEEAKEIMNDVIQNLEKINHHGKRADGIVKGMLQHSSSGSGNKEPTDINALADEYLRLAYHGLRAKDKSFNAAMKTEFDESIGNINIIPQDIGRVILNLITNAFYVVDEKKKSGVENYEPIVSVNTKKVGDKVLISVKDNGNGIPQKVLDKIFQPFFTTKPTGQGTGLGLSLSYDIVKAHGGELKVETKEGEGSEFIIQLAVV
ncbi:MAG: nuclear transport factor 2 family protein [Chitinophagaceae bacterium]|nr:nuclear transport factor 2 family protein [Chitinophagaceae bacterium]